MIFNIDLPYNSYLSSSLLLYELPIEAQATEEKAHATRALVENLPPTTPSFDTIVTLVICSSRR
jgi:hypothetical protein